MIAVCACKKEKEHTAPAIYDRDSVSMMVSYGVNTLISDSGMMRYRIVAEEWEVNTVRHPSRWIFNKGIFLEQFDQSFHIEAFVQADTAFYYDQNRLWELRGNVKIRTTDGLRFYSQELFWDQQKREFYSNMFSRLITPDRQMQGDIFRSDENMEHYYVKNTKGSFTSEDVWGEEEDDKTSETTPQSETETPQPPAIMPHRRTTVTE